MRTSKFFAVGSMGLLVSAVMLTNCQSAAPIPVKAPLVIAPLATRASDEMVRPDKPVAAPMTLTASDGTGLTLVQLTARAVVEDPLAFTELHLVFENPRDRVIEGNFSITLPPGATVSRFAMKLQDMWQEGEVVEKQAARRAYEDFLHRKQDPALLEQGAGNEFTARVFPIPARGRKELVLSYSQELGGSAPYALPLRGLPEVGDIDVAVTLPGNPTPVQTLKEAKFVPNSDFVLNAKYIKRSAGLRSGNLVLARVHPLPESHPDPVTSAIVLFDTSASRALGFEDQLHLLRRLVQRLAEDAGPKTHLLVACFDQQTEPIFAGEISAFGDKEIAKIRERDAFGASNLEQALGWAQERAQVQGSKRLIVMTDGVTTAGEGEADKLSIAALKLKTAGIERLDAISVGGIRDEALLHRLVTVGLARDGVVADGSLEVNAIGRKLNEATRSGLAVKVEGASWSYPTKLDGVQAGDEVLVYADVPANKPVKISVAGSPAGLELDNVERPLIERAWVQAKIASLLARESVEGAKPETQKEIIGLSVAYRVMSPYTALLVLETEADYARFKIDRSALSDVLTVENGRLALLKRNALPDFRAWENARNDELRAFPNKPPPGTPAATGSSASREPDAPLERSPQAPPPNRRFGVQGPQEDPMSARGNMWGDEVGDSFGAGGLGLSGVGEGGGGRGEGIGLGNVGVIGHGAGAGAPAPAARPRQAPPPPPMAEAMQQSLGGSGQGFGMGHGRLGG
ncbi:MAG: VIT domain-containing protein, partial [Polyangiaceae bacterium]